MAEVSTLNHTPWTELTDTKKKYYIRCLPFVPSKVLHALQTQYLRNHLLRQIIDTVTPVQLSQLRNDLSEKTCAFLLYSMSHHSVLSHFVVP